MKKIVIVAVIAVWYVPSAAHADERVGAAALGALSGAVVLGPIGAVAGAAIGYTAGPAIASSWGLRRSESPRRTRQSATPSRASSTPVNPPADPRRRASARTYDPDFINPLF